jgi:hypothetical protein
MIKKSKTLITNSFLCVLLLLLSSVSSANDRDNFRAANINANKQCAPILLKDWEDLTQQDIAMCEIELIKAASCMPLLNGQGQSNDPAFLRILADCADFMRHMAI